MSAVTLPPEQRRLRASIRLQYARVIRAGCALGIEQAALAQLIDRLADDGDGSLFFTLCPEISEAQLMRALGQAPEDPS